MRLSDLIGEADGLLPKTYMQRAQIFRLDPPDMTPRIIVVSLNEMKKGEANDPFLQEFDRIRIYSEAELGEGEPMVYAAGELKDGDISCPLADNMRVSDLVFQAGGLREGADIERAELARVAAPGKVEFYNLNLRKILKEGDRTEDLLLQRDDYLFVRTTPSYGSTETVSITGNVKFPGKYALYPGEKLSSLIARAGSYTGKAFLDGAVFIRPALIKQQEGNFDKLQAELTRRKNWELAQQPVNLPSGEADFRKRQIDDLYSVSADKLALETSGRVIIDLYNVRPGSTQDILLQNGDSLYIPDQQIGVTVIGEVAFPGTLIYERGKRAWDYVNGCGGCTAFADENKLLIVRANGRVDKGSRSSGVGPGDTIFVQSAPLQMVRYQEPFSWGVFWDNAMKATTTMVQVLTSVVTVYLLYKSAK
jgi:protein involved in polysaccharide export with SLBB domain